MVILTGLGYQCFRQDHDKLKVEYTYKNCLKSYQKGKLCPNWLD
jgi:hypothetical protein